MLIPNSLVVCSWLLITISNVSGDAVYEYSDSSGSQEVGDGGLTDNDFAAALNGIDADDDGDDDDEDPLFGGDNDYFEGDIAFREDFTIWSYVKPVDGDDDFDGYGSAIKSDHRRWTGGVIPYVITSDMSHEQRRVIAKAIIEYSKHTCIKWISRSNEQDYVRIMKGKPGTGCWSNVGKLGSVNIISLSGYQCFKTGVIIHEMMHTAGFFHEQSRADRDDYVTIVPGNLIKKKHLKNFKKYTLDEIDHLGTEYDCNSIMHYSQDAFALPGTQTILPKVDKCKNVGQRVRLSPRDIKDLNLLYNCEGLKNPTQINTIQCPAGWWSTTSACYKYLAFWKYRASGAETICKQWHPRAVLPWFNNGMEYKEFQNYIASVNGTAWLSMKRMNDKWGIPLKNGSQCHSKVYHWKANEPSNANNCVYEDAKASVSNGWKTKPCDNTNFVMCQIRFLDYACDN